MSSRENTDEQSALDELLKHLEKIPYGYEFYDDIHAESTFTTATDKECIAWLKRLEILRQILEIAKAGR